MRSDRDGVIGEIEVIILRGNSCRRGKKADLRRIDGHKNRRDRARSQITKIRRDYPPDCDTEPCEAEPET